MNKNIIYIIIAIFGISMLLFNSCKKENEIEFSSNKTLSIRTVYLSDGNKESIQMLEFESSILFETTLESLRNQMNEQDSLFLSTYSTLK